MNKRTKRMSRSAAERINRKDTMIRQNNAELEELRSQYENLDICEEDKQVIDDYIACKDARADRMAEKLYEKGKKRCKEMYPYSKTDPQMHNSVCHCYSGTGPV